MQLMVIYITHAIINKYEQTYNTHKIYACSRAHRPAAHRGRAVGRPRMLYNSRFIKGGCNGNRV